MSLSSNTYTETFKDNRLTELRTRTGGPRREAGATPLFARTNNSRSDSYGSHMPLDTGIHWEWSNPLNILPALVLFAVVLAIVMMVIA